MDFSEKIAELSKKVKNLGDGLKSEEATKNALVMPFIAALGYDVFNPSEVVPEFSAPIGEYKDARVDYAILSGGNRSFFWNARPWAPVSTPGNAISFKFIFMAQKRRLPF